MHYRICSESVRLLRPALALACAAAPGLAQTQPPVDPFTVPGLRLSADEPVVQEFERIAAARLSTSFDSDLVVLSDSRLTFFFQPSRFDWKREFVGSHRDLAVASGGDFDGVFTVDAGGLSQWSFDEPSATYSSAVVESGWGNVLRLSVTNSGLVAGWDPVANKVLRYDPNDLPTQDTSIDATPTEEGDFLDFVLMDWDDDGVEDIVLHSTTQIDVFHGETGASILSWATTGPQNQIAAVHGAGGDRDLLVWALDVSGEWYLRSQNSAVLNDGFLMLGAEAPGALHAADLQPGLAGHADASEELMLGLGDDRVWVLTRPPVQSSKGTGNPGQPPYQLVPDTVTPNSAYYQLLGVMNDGGGGDIVSGAGDIDRDGDLDPMFARSVDGEIAFQFDDYQPVDHPISKLDLAYASSSSSTHLVVNASELGRLPLGTTHVVVEVWRHANGSPILDQDMIAREFIDVVNPPSGGPNPAAALDLGSHGFSDVYHVALRAVAVSGPPLARQDPAIAEYQVDEAWLTFSAFTSQDPAMEPVYEAWPGVVAIATLPPPEGSGNDDPVLTGSGTQTGQGSRTPPQLPPIGGATGTGSTGRS